MHIRGSSIGSFLITVCMILCWQLSPAQQMEYRDTLHLDGPCSEHLSRYTTYWVDDSEFGTLNAAVHALENDRFAHWPLLSTLNVGLNPSPLWLHLILHNVAADPVTYWWSLYSHADSVVIFRQEDSSWHATDTLLFQVPQRERKVPVRFLATELSLRPGETANLLMRVRNLRTPQHAITDITTPAHNLLWEKQFFWTIGFFIGALTLVILFNLTMGVLTFQRVFFLFAGYILIVAFVILKEELMIVLYPSQALFHLLIRFSAMGLTIAGCGIHYFIIQYVISTPEAPRAIKIVRILNFLNLSGLMYGIAFSLLLFFFQESLSFAQPGYRLLWQINVGVIFVMMAVLAFRVLAAVRKPRHILPGVIVAVFLFYFNAAGYFLNYEGVISYYTITYPNYFFWGLCVEFITFALIIAWRYRKTLKSNYLLQQEKLLHKAQLFEKEVATQERERTQIARDIHDDLGATISALKLIITNSYRQDEHLVKMVNKASTDLRFFLTNFSVPNIREGLFRGVKQLIEEINSLGRVRFTLITSGRDESVRQDLAVAAFRIIAELMNNILKHAEATEATLQVMVDDEQLLIMAEDNGKGFDVSQEYHGMGLENIRTRARRFNGEVHTVSDSRSGTTSIINLPNRSL